MSFVTGDNVNDTDSTSNKVTADSRLITFKVNTANKRLYRFKITLAVCETTLASVDNDGLKKTN